MNLTPKPRMKLSEQFFKAVQYATEQHANQPRKSTDIPYICHPLGVASLVIESGGDEDQAIGGLLHDVAEDCGGEPRLVEIEQMFGSRVAEMVRGCSDSLVTTEGEKEKWTIRKENHIKHLETATSDVLIVTAADKLHNARAIATDFQIVGSKVWERFNSETTPQMITWYYREMLRVLSLHGVNPVLLAPLKEAINIFATN